MDKQRYKVIGHDDDGNQYSIEFTHKGLYGNYTESLYLDCYDIDRLEHFLIDLTDDMAVLYGSKCVMTHCTITEKE